MEQVKTTNWYMIQVKDPQTKKWVDWSGLWSKEEVKVQFEEITTITLNEWRIKEHKLVQKV